MSTHVVLALPGRALVGSLMPSMWKITASTVSRGRSRISAMITYLPEPRSNHSFRDETTGTPVCLGCYQKNSRDKKTPRTSSSPAATVSTKVNLKDSNDSSLARTPKLPKSWILQLVGIILQNLPRPFDYTKDTTTGLAMKKRNLRCFFSAPSSSSALSNPTYCKTVVHVKGRDIIVLSSLRCDLSDEHPNDDD